MTDKLRWKTLRLRDGYIVSSMGNETPWVIGRWKHLGGQLRLRDSGFRCSKRVAEAIGYVRGEVVARVAVKGAAARGADKEAYRSMKIVAAYEWTKEDSGALAVFAARNVLHIFEERHPGDDRPRMALEAAERWLDNPTAHAAAHAAAYAARAAYAASAAVYAVAYAAYAAAYAASAAAYAARDAAYAAASAAAYAAAYAYAYAARAASAAGASKKFKVAVDAWIAARLESKEEMS